MGDRTITGIVSIITAIIGVAIIAVLVSNKANTSGVLTAGGNAFANILKTAVSPVTGGSLSSGLVGSGSSPFSLSGFGF